MTGRFGLLPLGDGGVYQVRWTRVGKSQVTGTGKYTWGRNGQLPERPGHHPAYRQQLQVHQDQRHAHQSWYGTTSGSYPPYGHGAHHTTAHIHLAVNDPTTNLIRY